MPELDAVTQDISANVVAYLAAMDSIIAKAEEVAAATKAAEDAIAAFALATDDAAVLMGAAAGRMNDLRNALGGVTGASAETAAMQRNVADASADLMMHTALLASMDERLATIQRDVADSSADLMMQTQMMRESYGALDGQIIQTIGMLAALAAAQRGAAGATDQAGGAAGRQIGWFRLTANAIHWIIMGTLEIASTALPALVALTAGVLTMVPAFTFAKDQMTNLVIASGSLTGAIKNSAAPLSGMAAGLGAVQKAATPNAFIILGSAISVATTHTGVFAGMAQKASTVLADFATKIVTDLQGSAGAALSGFFSNAVKYMIQWGQLLGNLGHAFLNAVGAMWGVGQVLLDVLVGISRVLLAITSNPIGAWLIGVAAAMSALYRYSRLMVTIFNWLGGSALVNVIKGFAAWGAGILAINADLGAMAATAQVTGDLMDLALGPVGIAIMGVSAALGIWYLASRHTADATDTLIKKVQSAPATVQNLSSGIGQLSGELVKQNKLVDQTVTAYGRFGPAGKVLSGEATQARGDVTKLTTAIGQQQQKLIELQIALAQLGDTQGQVGHDMLALSISTDLQDSKVSQLTQAWDQYMSLVTGGTSGLGGFSEALTNIGKVTVTSAAGLQNYNATVGLTTSQSAAELKNFGQVGSQVWQNFNNALTGSAQPLADWLQTAKAAGAITGPAFTKSILDIASGMTKFAMDSKPAQAELVAFAQQAGLNIQTFPQLLKAIHDTGAGSKDLTKKVTDTTIAMGQLNQIAKNLSVTLSTDETQAIAAAALKASGFTTDINNMMQAQQTNSRVQGRTWQQWAAKAVGAQAEAQRSADTTTRKILAIKKAEDSLYNKTIHIDVTASGMGVISQLGGGGTTYTATPGGGYAGRGASGGFINGSGTTTSDSNLIRASHGEFIMQASAVDHYGRGVMEAMNAKRYASGGIVDGSGRSPVLEATLGGGGVVTLNQSQRFEVNLDGATIGSQQRRETLTYNRRNPGNNLSLRVR